ncbi:hypothetical protein GOD80_18395 [Sinorhizobium medicae]|uniref:hypothetical protein n=1 Tax=Sinorhizobium medicae TaxID=110321 RepID=UPI0004629755|nr:hypothetical protein [Sinorhizobium medicae]MDX0769594.1 hypothetical protein [Sinorhizobium medicae]MDX0807161.1 hypothetical protein [Sinorhizobium medicae]RVQ72869.1 hypothetical protein CN244_11710 [Sinorhizobium medicae]
MTMLSIPIRNDLIAEIFIRSNGAINPTDLVESLLADYLERTRGDTTIWTEDQLSRIDEKSRGKFLIKFGDPGRGFSWQGVFLPNGTQLRVRYRRKEYFANVRHGQVYYEDQPCSPSQFASRAANNTSRNAWNDVWVKRPSDVDWVFANNLRLALPSPFEKALKGMRTG